MKCSRSVLVAAFAATTLVAAGSDAAADITYAGTGTYTSGGYSYYETYASSTDECYAMGGTPICEAGPTIERRSGSGSLKGLVATPTTGLDPGTGAPGGPTTSARLLPEDGCQTTRCRMTTYTPPKYKYARTDDIMVWKNASPTSAAGKLQAVAFNGYAAHAGICYSADSGGCAYVYENNANDPDAEKQCSPWDEMHATLKNGLGGSVNGVHNNTVASFTRSGTLHLFRESSTTRLAEMRTRRSASINSKYYIASYSDEMAYGQCGSTVSAAFNLSTAEGARLFSASSAEAGALIPSMYNTLYAHISDKVENKWNFWASVGCLFSWNFKDEVKRKLTRVVMNVFLNDTTASAWDPPYPRARNISGVTAPVMLETYLRPENTCAPRTCAQLGKTCGTWSNKCGGLVNCGAGC